MNKLITAAFGICLTIASFAVASGQQIGGGGGSGGSGTVTTLSVATANGFAGTVATATTTPVITLTTSITGSVCSNGTALSACTTTGTGTTVLATSPSLVTPAIGVATATSVAIGGATIGTNALAVTGTTNITGGTLADQAQVLAITATQPTTPTAEQNAILWTITSAGSAALTNRALRVNYNSGFTGNANTEAFLAVNNVSGIANILIRNSGVDGASGNIGFNGFTNGVTSGLNVGAQGVAESGGVNAGVLGTAQVAKNSATNIGVVGSAINTGTSPVQIGGFFSLNQTTVPTVNAALIADNGSQTDAIALFRLNNVTKVSVEGSAGNLVVSTATDSTTTTSGSVQVAGGMAVRKRIFADGLTASAGLQTAVICQSSAGELIADSVACLASSARFKTVLGYAEVGAIDKIMRVPIYRWKYNKEGILKSDDWTRERIGPIAEEMAAVDSRLVGYGSDGKIRNISTEQLLALTIQALQEQQQQIDTLKGN